MQPGHSWLKNLKKTAHASQRPVGAPGLSNVDPEFTKMGDWNNWVLQQGVCLSYENTPPTNPNEHHILYNIHEYSITLLRVIPTMTFQSFVLMP